jgi:hypothetical protein
MVRVGATKEIATVVVEKAVKGMFTAVVRKTKVIKVTVSKVAREGTRVKEVTVVMARVVAKVATAAEEVEVAATNVISPLDHKSCSPNLNSMPSTVLQICLLGKPSQIHFDRLVCGANL